MKTLDLGLLRSLTIGAFSSLCMLAVLGSQASATTIVSRANPLAQHTFDNLPHFYILDPNSHSDALIFNCPARCSAAILYNAECSVAAFDTNTTINIDILVDERAIPPSDGDNIFCTSNGTGVLDSWVSASINVHARLLPGTHAVRVRGTLQNFIPGEQGWIDDISLIVITAP